MTEPSRVPKVSQSRFGFNRFTERLNARAAMIGFIGAIVVEVVTGQGVLTWLGLH